MAISGIPAGENLPHDFNVIIEISANGGAIKYEVDKDTGLLHVDRFMPTSMVYPCNYGYVPSTLADDGDPADVLMLSPCPIQPGSVVRGRAIGMLRMMDEAGADNKILAVPIEKACVEFAHIKSMDDLSPVLLDKLLHFFEQYKALESGKWVKTDGWADQAAAEKELQESVDKYKA